MVTILVLFAFLFAVAGALSLSNATLGVGLIGLALVCGVIARIAQADKHYRQPLIAQARPVRT